MTECPGCRARAKIGMAPMEVCPHQFAVSVATVVTDEGGAILMIRRRDNGKWELPGGIIEPHEPIEDGAAREVLEETGITIAIPRLVGLYKNPIRMFVRSVFHAVPSSGSVRTSAETIDVAWWSLDKTLAEATPDMAEAVVDALAVLEGGSITVRLIGQSIG